MNKVTTTSSENHDVINILLVSEPGRDGVFIHVERLARFLISRGHRVDLAYSSRRGSPGLSALLTDIRAAGGEAIDLNVSNQPTTADVWALYRLHRFISRRDPQVIHAHSSKAGALVRLLPTSSARRIFYTPHAYYGLRPGSHWQGRFYNRLERMLGRRGLTINVSKSEAGFAQTVLQIPAKDRLTIANGVDLQHFRPVTASERSAARTQLGIPQHKRVLACIARCSPQKDPQTLYRAFERARAAGADVHLLHVGDSSLPHNGQELLTEELAREVTRIQFIRDPLPIYQAADGFILTSRYEGLSYVVIEALACGLPLILSNVPGNDDILRLAASAAVSFPSGDVAAAASLITAWATGSDAHNNHHSLAQEHFDEQSCFSRIEGLYHIKTKRTSRLRTAAVESATR